MRIGVNLFAAQVRSGTLASDVTAALRRHRLPPTALELEITETIVLSVEDAVIDQFRDLHRQGIGIAFDDFGTGYASLSSLKRFPLTRLKIDRSFVRDLMSERHDAAVVRAIIQIGTTQASTSSRRVSRPAIRRPSCSRWAADKVKATFMVERCPQHSS